MNLFLRTSLLSLTFLCLAPAQAQTVAPTLAQATGATACTGPVTLSNVERRVVESAAQGDKALIQFVYRTRMIYQLDLLQTAAWVDERRAAFATCGIATTDSPSSSAS